MLPILTNDICCNGNLAQNYQNDTAWTTTTPSSLQKIPGNHLPYPDWYHNVKHGCWVDD
jgi:hypothetical protein